MYRWLSDKNERHLTAYTHLNRGVIHGYVK